MKKLIFKEFKQYEITKLGNIFGSDQKEPIVYMEKSSADAYFTSSFLCEDRSQQNYKTGENNFDLGDCDYPQVENIFLATPLTNKPIGNILTNFSFLLLKNAGRFVIKPSFLLYALFYTLISYSQTSEIKTYWNIINQGYNELYLTKDTNLAVKHFDSAHFYFRQNFKNSACQLNQILYKLHAILKNDSMVFYYIKDDIFYNQTNSKPEFYDSSVWGSRIEYKSFRNSKYWGIFNLEYQDWYKNATKHYDVSFVSQFKAFYYLDQAIRSSNELRDLDSFFLVLKITDAYNYKKFYNFSIENGFLDSTKYGSNIAHLNSILIHNFRNCYSDSSLLKISQWLDSALHHNVLIGRYPNELYAYYKDRSYAYFCSEPQLYGTFFTYDSNLRKNIIINGLQDVENIDSIRASIGLSSLYIHSLKHNINLPDGYKIP